MERRPVASSSIVAVGYDPASRVLEIEFRKGSTYRFFDVPEFLYRGLMLAPSKGSFYNRNVEDRYRYEDITAPRNPY